MSLVAANESTVQPQREQLAAAHDFTMREIRRVARYQAALYQRLEELSCGRLAPMPTLDDDIPAWLRGPKD